MICYICQQPCTGQCQVCWKFYCHTHGDVLCQPCQQQRDAAQRSGGEASATLLGTHDEPRDRPPDLNAQPIQRVIGVAQTTRHAETEMDLVFLELYEEGFIAHFRLRGTSPGPSVPGIPGMGSHPDFSAEATDDLGNTCQGWRRGGGGGNGHYRASMHFSPAVADQASVLNVTIDEVRWLAFGPGQRSAIEIGTWEFRVEL